MKTNQYLLAGASVLLAPLHAATINFNAASDYTSNFTPAFSSGNAVVWESANLRKNDNGGASGTTSMVLFNTAATSANFSLKMDLRFDASLNAFSQNGLSGGFLTHVAGGTGYVTIFRLTGTTTADVRIFEGINTSTGAVGTQIGSSTITRSSGTWSESSYYTVNLDVVNSGGSVAFTGSVLSSADASVFGTFTTITDNTPTNVSALNVGFRLGVTQNDIIRMDNFTLTSSAIPEPSTYALLGGAGVLGLAIWNRRRRS
ncbi:MAG: hypothetical protein K0R17_353 [Rariglobus sp.]|jgi:hypothetical protein|nr:hypothetical protein [Rariglobus sp.]